MITIKEAIKDITLLQKLLSEGTDPKFLAALSMSNEALKRIQECRHADHTIKEDYLPGEKKE